VFSFIRHYGSLSSIVVHHSPEHSTGKGKRGQIGLHINSYLYLEVCMCQEYTGLYDSMKFQIIIAILRISSG